jgi:predicted RNA-binding protein with PIN domain
MERGEPGVCRLRFDARYVPPAGRLGASVDRAVMYRVAEATVDDFVDRVAALLGAEGPA